MISLGVGVCDGNSTSLDDIARKKCCRQGMRCKQVRRVVPDDEFMAVSICSRRQMWVREVRDDRIPNMEEKEIRINVRFRKGRSDRSGPLRNVFGISHSRGDQRVRLSSTGKGRLVNVRSFLKSAVDPSKAIWRTRS